MKTPDSLKTRTGDRGLLRDALRETADFSRHGGRIDWIALSYPLLSGALIGACGALLVVGENPLTMPLAAGAVTLGALAGALTSLAGAFVLVLTVMVFEQVGVRRAPARRRRKDLREEIRHLRKAVRTGRVPLAEIGRVTAHLRMRDEREPHPEASSGERLLWKRLQRHRRRVDAVLETSWRDSLHEAIETLRSVHATRSTRPLVIDDVPTAWYLERTPADLAVSRLLVEYLDGERDRRTGNVAFVAGVVFTPRWVYELAQAGSHHAYDRRMAPPGRYVKRSRGGIGDECVDIGSADRETVAKLYDHGGNGPMKSLWDTVEAAKRL